MHGSMSDGASLSGSVEKLGYGGVIRDDGGGGGMSVGFTGLDTGSISGDTSRPKSSNGRVKSADNVQTRTIFGTWTKLPARSAGAGVGGRGIGEE